MEETPVLYTDLTEFISKYSGWVNEKNPLRIRARKLKTKWGVELSVSKGEQVRRVLKPLATRHEAEDMARKMSARFKRSLKHVA